MASCGTKSTLAFKKMSLDSLSVKSSLILSRLYSSKVVLSCLLCSTKTALLSQSASMMASSLKFTWMKTRRRLDTFTLMTESASNTIPITTSHGLHSSIATTRLRRAAPSLEVSMRTPKRKLLRKSQCLAYMQARHQLLSPRTARLSLHGALRMTL